MAISTTTTASEAIYAAIIEATFKEELGPATVIAPFARFHDLSGEASLAWSVPKLASPTLSTDLTVAEGSDIGSSETFDPAAVTITSTDQGILSEMTDALLTATQLQEGLAAEIGQWLTRRVAREVEKDLCGLFSSFTTSVGTTLTNIDEQDWLLAIFNLELNNSGMPIVAGIHPAHASHIRQGMLLSTAGTTNLATASILRNIDPASIGKSNAGAGGLWMDVFGVPTYITTQVPLSTDRHGGMFTAGQAIGIAAKYFGRVEFQRNASLRSTEIVVNSFYGVGEIEDLQGVRLIAQNAG